MKDTGRGIKQHTSSERKDTHTSHDLYFLREIRAAGCMWPMMRSESVDRHIRGIRRGAVMCERDGGESSSCCGGDREWLHQSGCRRRTRISGFAANREAEFRLLQHEKRQLQRPFLFSLLPFTVYRRSAL